ncbi:MAG: hypothetical protein FJ146_12395 [Deltaproteobacteria bacterium]|nr:hypothetical protein [Deltaproteobacteria bacterium]
MLAACDASSSGPLQLPGFSFDLGQGRSNDQPESQTADPPQQIVGAYLTCAFIDAAENVAAKGRNGENIEIGCGLYKRGATKQQKKPELANITGLQSKTAVSCRGRKTVRSVSTKAASTKTLQNQFAILTSELPCQVQWRLSDQGGRRALFAKSIPTITQSNAQEGFDIEADMQEQQMAYADDASSSTPQGLSTRAPNSPLMQQIARDIGGPVGDDIARAENQNFNGGRLIGLKAQHEFVPGLNTKQVSAGGIVLGSSGYGVSGGGGAVSGSSNSQSPTSKTSDQPSNRDDLTPEEKRKLQQRQAKALENRRAAADEPQCSQPTGAQAGSPITAIINAVIPVDAEQNCEAARPTKVTPPPGPTPVTATKPSTSTNTATKPPSVDP